MCVCVWGWGFLDGGQNADKGRVVGIHSQPFKVICMALKLEIQLS